MWGNISARKQGTGIRPAIDGRRARLRASGPRQGGFTLIEILVALVIVAILATVAVPSYLDYMIEGRLSQATGTLSTLATQLEKAYLDQRSYANPDDAGECAVDLPAGADLGFTYACVPRNNGDGYLLTASNKAGNGLGAVGDYQYTLDEAGNRGTVFFDGTEVNRDCWMLTEGAC